MLKQGALLFAMIGLVACSGQPTGPVSRDAPAAGGPAAEAPIDRSVKGAVNVVRRYYAAIDAGDFDTAYAQWGESGPPGQAYDDFVSGFARTVRVTVEITGEPRPEGAAGSIYARVPVSIRSELADGRWQHFEGYYVVRRVNDVPGSTEAQRRWHLEGADLHKVR
ncbi:hypothetical protein EZI54_21550 [Marinobacter halodurans]|uniref:SnoaL-like domain-containing protein n=1 Tax=Marinobacter halodurans TaxID=2528979 RepID=A0ABY1ZE85_9GAMM|nr:hypothetical protein [Marinobacter halodurans]TBW48224.1 hypothetical protein EZI54_21550 [Marinobacter halodurans]